MKQIKSFALLGLILSVFTSCLKDKDFDNGEYGVKPSEQKAVSFPQSSLGAPYSIAIVSASTVIDLGGVIVALESTNAQSQDVNVRITSNPSLITDPALTILPADNLSFPGTFTIKAGKFLDTLPISLANSADLDPTLTYAFGLTLESADQGFQIPANLRNLIVTLSIKNRYDGIYTVESGLTTRYLTADNSTPANDALSGPLAGNPDVYLITRDANTCDIPIPGAMGSLYWSGGVSGVAGINGLTVSVDPTTFAVTVASSTLPNLANWAGHDNSYDPSTQTFHLAFNWTSTTGLLREYEIELKYKEARP